MRIDLITVPYDSGRRGERMGAGPEHLLRAGLPDRLTRAGHQVAVRVLEAPLDGWQAEIRTTFALAGAVAAAVRDARAGGAFPLILSGNCGPAALGGVAGADATPAVFWFDAHGDFNTPETTLGGFLDGMALATLAGRCWTRLAAALPGFRPVPEELIALIGARDLDPPEAAALGASAVQRLPAHALDARLPAVLASLRRRATAAYLHLDLDVLDPGEGRANSYAAPAGLTRDAVERAAGTIAAALPPCAAALTAFDPTSDPTGRACETALALATAVVERVALSRSRSQ